MSMSPAKCMCGIFALAIIARLTAFWVLPEPHMAYNAIYAYVKGAEILLEGQGFADPSFPVYTPPLYSVLIAIVTAIFGDGILTTKLLQIAVDSLTAALTCLLFRNVFGDFTGILTGIMWALYPFTIYSTLYIGTEVFFTFFLALFVVLIVHGIQTDKWYSYCAAGAVLGLATLIRGSTQFIPLILPFVLFAFGKGRIRWLRNYVLSLMCFVIVILPWSIRNYVVLHEIIPVGANSTVILYGTYEPLLTIDTRQAELTRLFAEAKAKGILPPGEDRGPAERDAFLAKVAIENYRERLRADPIGLAVFMVQKFFRLWYSTESGNNHGITLAVNAGIYAFAVVGIFATWKNKNGMALMLLGLVIYFVIIHWLTLPLFRYMLPVMPYVIAFAAFGLLFVIERRWPEVPERFALRSIPLSSGKNTHQG